MMNHKRVGVLFAILALFATACNYDHTATTLTVIDDDEFTGDDPFVSVLSYRTTPGTAGSSSVVWQGGTGSITNNVSEGDVLAIPSAIGNSNLSDIDYGTCEGVSQGEIPELVGQVIVAFEDDFSNQQADFMNFVAGSFTSDLIANVENMTFADLNDCAGVANTIAAALPSMASIETTISENWVEFDEGLFTDDDDLVGTGFTAYMLATNHITNGLLNDLVEAAFSAQLTAPNQAGGSMNDPVTSDGRTDSVTVSGSGSTYTIQILLDNLDFVEA